MNLTLKILMVLGYKDVQMSMDFRTTALGFLGCVTRGWINVTLQAKLMIHKTFHKK